jgi:protein required for attachment to host cells
MEGNCLLKKEILSMETCILVATGTRASIYNAKKADLGDLEVVEHLDHLANLEMNREILADRPGHFVTDSGARGDYEKSDPKEVGEDRFALTCARKIKDTLYGKKFKRLIIASPPHFHGLLNKHLEVNNIEIVHIKKDYTALKLAELVEQLRKFTYNNVEGAEKT